MVNFPPNYAEQELYYASEQYQTGAKNAIANNQPLPTYENPNPVSNSEVTPQPPRTPPQSKKRGGILRYPLEALTGTTDYLQIDIKEYFRQFRNTKLIGAKGFGRNTLNNRWSNSFWITSNQVSDEHGNDYFTDTLRYKRW